MIRIYTLSDTSWFSGSIQYFLAPLTVALLAYFLLGKRDEYKKRKTYSLLGVELLTILIAEIEAGYQIIVEQLNPKELNQSPNPLPFKSWNGISTIQDEILLRIFEVSKDIPDYEYHPNRIRIHTKNYYEYIIHNWEKMVLDIWDTKSNNDGEALLTLEDKKTINDYKHNYGKATHDLLQMLKETHKLLKENAKKPFPK